MWGAKDKKAEPVLVQMCEKVPQSPVVGHGQLAEEVSDLENDCVHLGARTKLVSNLVPLTFISLCHYHPLALFGQANKVVVESVEEQRLR